MKTSFALGAALLSFGVFLVNVSNAANQQCELINTANTGTQFSSTLLDEISIIAGDVRPLELVSRISDLNGDSVREVLALEGSNSVVIRNGANLDQIASGAFPFVLPEGAVPTQMGTIGDLEGDGIEEVAIGVRYVGNTRGQSVFVFRGSTLLLLQTYPSTIGDLEQRIDTDEPRYPNPPPVSRIGVSAQVTDIGGRRQIVYIDPNVAGGTVVFKTECVSQFPLLVSYSCFDTRTLRKTNVAPRNMGVKSIGVASNPGGPRTIFIGDPSSDSLPVSIEGVVDTRKNMAGAIIKLENSSLSVYQRGDRANLRLGFDMALSTGPIQGQNSFLSSAPTDGISITDTGDFLLFGLASSSLNRRFSPLLSEENIDFGYSLDGGDDLTADGVPDVAIGAPGERNQGRVRIYSPTLDYFNRSILRVAGDTIRFGHSVASVGAGRLVVADAAGKLYALRVSGDNKGSLDAITCSVAAPIPPAQPTPNLVSYAEIEDLRAKAARISTLVGSLKYQQGRVGKNREILAAIRKQTEQVAAALRLANVQTLEPKFNASYAKNFVDRAANLQKIFAAATPKSSRAAKKHAAKRRDAQKLLTNKANEIVRLSAAASSR